MLFWRKDKMIEKTKSINKVHLKSKEVKDKLVVSTYITSLADEMFQHIEKKIQDKKISWIRIYNQPYYFVKTDNTMIIDPTRYKVDSKAFTMFSDFKWVGMKEWFIKKWFIQNKQNNPLFNNKDYIRYKASDNQVYDAKYIFCNDLSKTFDFQGNTTTWGINDTDSIKISLYFLNDIESKDKVRFIFNHNLNIFDKGKLQDVFNLLISLEKNGFFEYSEDGYHFIINNDQAYEYIQSECEKYNMFEYFDDSQVWKIICSETYDIPEYIRSLIIDELLNCDAQRVNMEKYPIEIVKSPEFGHWELWDDNDTDDYCVHFEESLVARNPVYDALDNKSGVIGIDFGTKSTVVTYRQSRADVLPMRIGSGKYSRAVSQSDYENPTVMELRDVQSFLAEYYQYEGRPYTKWENLLISHEAAEQLKSEQGRGETFATFFSDLKQWASDKTRQVKLRDLKGKEINIPSYLKLDNNDFDPIEIYAYYLGLFINNMLHKVYLRYKLSFPATVEKIVRDKLLDSFTRGIKKSLPQQVIDNEECMKLFKVEQGASEPAAYAISALQEYGFDPEEDEKHYYGIFDFGGGTTDFDFGVWSGELEEPENYDYQISHFGQGGDPYLGGENLLGFMAYQVFNDNYSKLLQDGIVFIRPFGEKEVAGKDWLVKQDSQYAQFNHKRLMEKLRGVWEKNEEAIEKIQGGTIELPLFNKDGELKKNYSLNVSLDKLEELIRDRIEKGIIQFFSALKNCFGVGKNKKDIFNINEINIFLAGNSSKSPVVMDLFKKHIDLWNKALDESIGENRNWIKIYPPLGTNVADAVIRGEVNPYVDDIINYNNDLKEKAAEHDSYDETEFCVERIQRPTGKTGVAFGLLNNRVRVVQNETEEIAFRYYIGQNRKNKFFCVIDKDIAKYNEWHKFCLATKEEFDIWFTRSADAPSNKLSIDQMGIYSEIGFVNSPTKEKSVYIRLTTPTDIEYIISSEEEIKNGSYSESEIVLVSLQEKQ